MPSLVLDEPKKDPRLVLDEPKDPRFGSGLHTEFPDLPGFELSDEHRTRMENSLYYTSQYNIPPEMAFDMEPELTKEENLDRLSKKRREQITATLEASGVPVQDIVSMFNEIDAIGFIESTTEEFVRGAKGAQLVPILGGVVGMAEQYQLLDAASRLQEDFDYSKPIRTGEMRPGATGTVPPAYGSREHDQKLIGDFLLETIKRQERGYKWHGVAAKGLIQMPTWMVEFALTGGLNKIGSEIVQTAGEKLLKRYAQTKVGQVALKTAGWAGGAITRASLGLSPRVGEKTLQRQVSVQILGTEEEGWATSFAKAWGDTVIEAASETAGEAITGIPVKLLGKTKFGTKFLKELEKGWMKATGGSAGTFAREMAAKGGYSNIIGEYGEERLGTLLRGITGADDFGAGQDAGPIDRLKAGFSQDIENLGAELVVLAVPMTGQMVVGQLTGSLDRIKTDNLVRSLDAVRKIDPQKAKILERELIGRGVLPEVEEPIAKAKEVPAKKAPTEPVTAPQAPAKAKKAVEATITPKEGEVASASKAYQTYNRWFQKFDEDSVSRGGIRKDIEAHLTGKVDTLPQHIDIGPKRALDVKEGQLTKNVIKQGDRRAKKGAVALVEVSSAKESQNYWIELPSDTNARSFDRTFLDGEMSIIADSSKYDVKILGIFEAPTPAKITPKEGEVVGKIPAKEAREQLKQLNEQWDKIDDTKIADMPDLVGKKGKYRTKKEATAAISAEIKRVRANQEPVLVDLGGERKIEVIGYGATTYWREQGSEEGFVLASPNMRGTIDKAIDAPTPPAKAEAKQLTEGLPKELQLEPVRIKRKLSKSEQQQLSEIKQEISELESQKKNKLGQWQSTETIKRIERQQEELQNQLPDLYETRPPTLQDYKKAVKWYEKNKKTEAADILRKWITKQEALAEAKPVEKEAEPKKAKETAFEGEPGTKPMPVEKDVVSDKELPSITSVKNAAIAADREALGLDQIASPTRKSSKEYQAEAIEKGIPEKALRLAAEYEKNPPVSLDPVVEAGMNVKMARLKKEYRGLMAEVKQTTDEAKIKSLSSEMDVIESELELIGEVVTKSGMEGGRKLEARKLNINDELDFVSVKIRAKAAKGKALTAEETQKIKELTTKFEAAEVKIEGLQAQVDILIAQNTVIGKRGAKRRSKMSFDQKIDRINKLLKEGCY